MACGALNGAIVIYCRLQPIIATIAAGAVFFGLTLRLRPYPGTTDGLAEALTGKVFGLIPAGLAFLFVVVLVVWAPFRRSMPGRTVCAVGSSPGAACMSGLPVRAARFSAFVLSGFMAAAGGLFLTCIIHSGEAVLANGDTCTLFL